MKTSLGARIDKIAAQLTREVKSFPSFIFKVFDRHDDDVIGLMMCGERIARWPGETVSELFERARSGTGSCMWAADYRDVDADIDGSTPAPVKNTPSGGQS
jgi:hypothetical protein